MLTATVLALSSAVLHAGWNLALKQSTGDRFLLLWGQFFLAAVLVTPFVTWRGLPGEAWARVALSGAVHLPYVVCLARGYDLGDFSLIYPIARGGGAMLAAIGGVLFLDDQLSAMSAVGIATVGIGLFALAGRWNGAGLRYALIVACTIGVYSVSDAKGNRITRGVVYSLATHIGTAASTTLWGLAHGRRDEMVGVLRTRWRRLALAGVASTVTYSLVQIAFRYAPVGYVTALRESSVVIAAIVGWRSLKEKAGTRRVFASLIVAAGLVLVVVGRTGR